MFNEFENIALRAFDPGFRVGDTMPNSFVWVDGECFEDEPLNGACGLKITSSDDLNAIIAGFRAAYAWGDRIVYVIGGDSAEYGNDVGEIIIRKAKILKVLG